MIADHSPESSQELTDLREQLAKARREADMHRRHATELRAHLLDLGDAVIVAITSGTDPVAYLRAWARGLSLTPVASDGTGHPPECPTGPAPSAATHPRQARQLASTPDGNRTRPRVASRPSPRIADMHDPRGERTA